MPVDPWMKYRKIALVVILCFLAAVWVIFWRIGRALAPVGQASDGFEMQWKSSD